MKAPKKKTKHEVAFQIRMSAELLETIQGAAELATISTSGWARTKLLEAARAEYRKAGKEPPDVKP